MVKAVALPDAITDKQQQPSTSRGDGASLGADESSVAMPSVPFQHAADSLASPAHCRPVQSPALLCMVPYTEVRLIEILFVDKFRVLSNDTYDPTSVSWPPVFMHAS